MAEKTDGQVLTDQDWTSGTIDGCRQNLPDGTTITTNESGEIQVSKPSKIIIGDFETDTGDWNFTNNADTTGPLTRQNGYAWSGTYSLGIESQWGIWTMEKNVDFTDIDFLIFHFKTERAYDLTVTLDGSSIYSQTVGPTGSDWYKIEIDVSDKNGTQSLQFEFDVGGTADFMVIDYIYLKTEMLTTSDGAGGMA